MKVQRSAQQGTFATQPAVISFPEARTLLFKFCASRPLHSTLCWCRRIGKLARTRTWIKLARTQRLSDQDMGVIAGVVYCTTLLLQLAIVSLCTLWPIKHDLALLTRPHGWRQLYSLANSNLDVWVLSTTACLANIICLASVASFSLNRETSHKAPAYKTVQVLVAVLAILSQVCSNEGSS